MKILENDPVPIIGSFNEIWLSLFLETFAERAYLNFGWDGRSKPITKVFNDCYDINWMRYQEKYGSVRIWVIVGFIETSVEISDAIFLLFGLHLLFPSFSLLLLFALQARLRSSCLRALQHLGILCMFFEFITRRTWLFTLNSSAHLLAYLLQSSRWLTWMCSWVRSKLECLRLLFDKQVTWPCKPFLELLVFFLFDHLM